MEDPTEDGNLIDGMSCEASTASHRARIVATDIFNRPDHADSDMWFHLFVWRDGERHSVADYLEESEVLVKECAESEFEIPLEAWSEFSRQRLEVLAAVREVIVQIFGCRPDKVVMHADVEKDLGITGDDADDLFSEIDKRFKIDWGDLNLGVHFGSEGFGLPFPWQLKNSAELYRHQACTVEHLVDTIESGRWVGSNIVPISQGEVMRKYVLSTLQSTILIGIFVAGFVKFFS